MPTIFDNIENDLLTALNNALGAAHRGDFSVGYFNLRGWRALDSQVDAWEDGEGKCCRLIWTDAIRIARALHNFHSIEKAPAFVRFRDFLTHD